MLILKAELEIIRAPVCTRDLEAVEAVVETTARAETTMRHC